MGEYQLKKPNWLTPVSMLTPAALNCARVNRKSRPQRLAARVSLTPGLPPPKQELVSQIRYATPAEREADSSRPRAPARASLGFRRFSIVLAGLSGGPSV